MSSEMIAYQQRVDQALRVLPDERRSMAEQRRLPVRLRDQHLSSSTRRLVLGVSLFGLLAAGGALATVVLWSGEQHTGMEAVGAGALPVFFGLLFVGIFAVTGMRNRAKIQEGIVEVRDGVLRLKRQGGKSTRFDLSVDGSVWFSVSEEVYVSLSQGNPHRIYALPGTNIPLAIEALS